jgi:hypothetical protein
MHKEENEVRKYNIINAVAGIIFILISSFLQVFYYPQLLY